MTTGLTKLLVKTKMLLGVSDLKDMFLDYLDSILETFIATTHPTHCTFGQIGLVGSGANEYSLNPASPNADGVCTNGSGKILKVSESEKKGGIVFQNANGTTYYVGLRHCEVPSGIRTNPKTGRMEYVGMKDEIGVAGQPASIEDNGPNSIVLSLNNLLVTSGDNYTGRYARVWLNTVNENVTEFSEAVVDAEFADAYEVELNSSLGQSVLSLDPADYTVAILGPDTTSDVSELEDANSCVIGAITGNASTPTVFNYSDQNVVESKSWTNAMINGVTNDVLPATANALDLGSSTLYWARLYVEQMFYKTSATTFDNLNDLDLVEAYAPTGKFIDKMKGGEKRSVQTADVTTLPWPVVGDIDKRTGEVFIDAGDSVCFLLGALKQMYQLHKADKKTMEAMIRDLETKVKNAEQARA